jgi:hypothetical protein
MWVQLSSRGAHRSTAASPGRRVLFVVSRDLPDRYESLAYAFDDDYGVRVIFDRRRADRRHGMGASTVERRHKDRRSAARDWMLRSVGWVRIDGAARPPAP